MRLGLTWNQPLGEPECPYAYRWVLNLGPLGSIRLHRWIRSDDKRAKHDHPADFVTLVLKGSYTDLGMEADGYIEVGSNVLHRVDCPDFAHVPDDRRVFMPWDTQDADDPRHDCMSPKERMTAGKIAYRKAEHRHTVAVDPGGCWTLLYFKPDRRHWGFYVPRRLDGRLKFKKANKYFLEHGHHPCDQP
jgi:hypothetical protein